MRSIIFANFLARDTENMYFTVDVDNSYIKLLGNLMLNLWDCGGQEVYMDSFFNSRKEQIFNDVQVLIYVIDIEATEHAKDLRYFRSCLEGIQAYSPKATVFCLIHKMDLIPEDQRDLVFRQKETELKTLSSGFGLPISFFATSIWDATLYKAWSAIIYSLIPDMPEIETNLERFCDACDADEVVLFESATFLEIAHVIRKEHPFVHRFEQISNIVKQFKLNCTKSSTTLSTIHIRNASYDVFLGEFTPATFIMVVISDRAIEPALTRANIEMARHHFAKLDILQGEESE